MRQYSNPGQANPLYKRAPKSTNVTSLAGSTPMRYKEWQRPGAYWNPDDEQWYIDKSNTGGSSQTFASRAEIEKAMGGMARPYEHHSDSELDSLRWNSRREAHDILARNNYRDTRKLSASDYEALSKAEQTWQDANAEEGYRHVETVGYLGQKTEEHNRRYERRYMIDQERERQAQERLNARKLQKHQEKEVIDQKKEDERQRKQAKAYYKQQKMQGF